MPSVREPGDDTPEILEVVEVRPGVTLQLNAADRKAWQAAATPMADVSVDDDPAVIAAPKPRARK